MGGKGWQDETEECGIFDGELAGQPVFIGIEEHQLGLQAGDLGRRCREMFRSHAQLTGFRHVLGIEDGEQGAARKLQGIVEGARLGLGFSGGDDDDIKLRRQQQPGQGALHGDVGFLQYQLDVELGCRVIAALGSKRTKE